MDEFEKEVADFYDDVKEYYSGLKDIFECAKYLMELQKKNLKLVKSNINFIVKNKITDNQLIEQTLDKLLDLSYWLDVNKEFYYLNTYYEKINFAAAKDYEQFFLEITSEVSDKEEYSLK